MPTNMEPAGVWKQRPIRFETLKQLNLDPAKYPTCSQPVKGSNIGCRKWGSCKIAERMTRPNPRRVGIQILKKSASGRVRPVNRILDCFHIEDVTSQAVLNGGGYRVVANEGEEIKLTYSEHGPILPGSVLPKIVKGVKPFKVEPYSDPMDELLDEEIGATALVEFERRGDEEKTAELVAQAAGSAAKPKR